MTFAFNVDSVRPGKTAGGWGMCDPQRAFATAMFRWSEHGWTQKDLWPMCSFAFFRYIDVYTQLYMWIFTCSDIFHLICLKMDTIVEVKGCTGVWLLLDKCQESRDVKQDHAQRWGYQQPTVISHERHQRCSSATNGLNIGEKIPTLTSPYSDQLGWMMVALVHYRWMLIWIYVQFHAPGASNIPRSQHDRQHSGGKSGYPRDHNWA